MIPLQLRLSGFLSYREPVLVDFTGFNLACISGQNGAGKSSLLDAITWALFGQARKRDDSVINSACEAAEVILDFEYEGATYRLQRSKRRDKSTDLQFFQLSSEGKWKPLTEASLRETEHAVEDTLRMDYETFINASFFLQGKADIFAQQRPGDRKRILSSILGLEVWETYRVETAERRKALEQEVHRLEGSLGEIEQELREEESRRQALTALEANLKNVSTERLQQEKVVDNLRRLSASLSEQRRLVEGMEQRLRAAQKAREVTQAQLTARQEEERDYLREIERAAQIEAAYAEWQAQKVELERWEQLASGFREQEKKRNAPLMEIEAERRRMQEECRTLDSERARIEAAQASLPALRDQLAAADQAIHLTKERLERRSQVERETRELHVRQAQAVAQNPILMNEMKELRERIDRLKEATGVCPTCGQPLTPEHCHAMVGELEGYGLAKKEQYVENKMLVEHFQVQMSALEKELAELSSADKDLIGFNRQSDHLAAQIAEIERRADEWEANGALRLQALNRALELEDFAREARVALAEVDAGLKAIGYDAASHDAVRRAELVGRGSGEEFRQLEVARATLAPLQREIAGLVAQMETQSAEIEAQQQGFDQASRSYAESAANLPDMDEAESLLMDLQEQENRLRMDVGAARQKVAVLKDLRERQGELHARRQSLAANIGRHKMLEKAFSKDGVPALLIEQALPEIESQANEILDRLSGGSMSVRFETQAEYKDKHRDDLKETLEIRISDGAGTRAYEMFSGGEAFRVNFAIRLALSRVLAQRAGARLQTLVIDEGFGSQDVLGRQRLVEAINLVQKDFSKILVITHMEELKDAFPNRIEVEKTPRGSIVQVI